MDVPHPLQSILQFYLISDASAVLYSQQVLEQLSPSCFAPSPHLQKWCTRVTSLMHSRDPGTRWAGISFAYRSSVLSESLLVEHAQTWIGVVLPLLSKPEPKPILKASMRYLRLVLSTAINHPEFQRQIAAPAVPKIGAAMISITENLVDTDMMTLAIQTLSQLVMLYPSQVKASSSKLFTLCHRVFSGSAPQETGNRLLNATAELYSVLHYLAGKAGGANAWRSCLDTVLQSSWTAWAALRTTFPKSATHSSVVTPLNTEGSTSDPPTATANCLDRLKCNVTAICALLRAPLQRPVKVPIGLLVNFGYTLLTCTDEEQIEHFDLQVRALEVAALPQFWVRGCQLLSCLSQTAQSLMASSVSRLLMVIACRLETIQEASQRVLFLRTAYDLLRCCPVIGAHFALTRLMKAIIPTLSSLCLSRSAQAQESTTSSHSQSKASRKRRRDFQDDRALSIHQPLLCVTTDECHAIITSLDAVHEILKNVDLPLSVRSPASRVLVTILLSLPSIPPQSLSSDPKFYGQLINKVREICLKNASGACVMSKSVGLVLRSCVAEGRDNDPSSRAKLESYVDLLVHPRRPPLARTLPLEVLSIDETRSDAAIRSYNPSQQDDKTEPSYSKSPAPIKVPEPIIIHAHTPSQQNKKTERSHSKSPDPVKILEPIYAPLEVHTSQPRLSSPRLSQHHPDISPSLSDGVADLPKKSDTPLHPAPPPTTQHLPALHSQVQVPKLVGSGPAILIADNDDNDELPSIDMDSDSDY